MNLGRVTAQWTLRPFDIAVVGAVAIMAMGPSLFAGPPQGESYLYNLSWLQEFVRQFWDGELYPRRLERLWRGGGGYDFFIYPPLMFWVAAIVAPLCLGCSPSSVYVASGVILLALSGFTFIIFARRHVAPRAALIGALLYMALPYHLAVDWFVRNAVAEFAAFIFVPLVVHYATKYVETRRGGKRLAFSIAGLLLSHLPIAMLAAGAIGCGALWLLVVDGADAPKRFRRCLGLLGWCSIGLALSAFYWLPAVSLVDDLTTGFLFGNGYSPLEWLFLDGKPEPFAGIALTLKVIVSLYTIAWLGTFADARRVGVLVWFVPLGGLALISMTPLFYSVWAYTPLKMVQFPWRYLVLFDFAVAIGCTAMIARLLTVEGDRTPLRDVVVLASVVLAIVTGIVFGFPTMGRTLDAGPDAPLIGPIEYLPPAVTRTVLGDQQEKGAVATAVMWDALATLDDAAFVAIVPDGSVAVTRYSSRRYQFEIEAPDAGRASVKIFYWRHWRALNVETREPIELAPDGDNGLITFDLPSGSTAVQLQLPLHDTEKAGWLALVLSLGLCVVHGVVRPPKRITEA